MAGSLSLSLQPQAVTEWCLYLITQNQGILLRGQTESIGDSLLVCIPFVSRPVVPGTTGHLLSGQNSSAAQSPLYP